MGIFSWLAKSAQQVHEARAEVATEAAREAHRLFILVEGTLGGVHPDMPNDPFIVGALASYAAIFTKILSNGRAPLVVAEQAMVQAMQLSFGTLGVDRMRALGILHQFKEHPDYVKAAQVSTLILAARIGKKDMQGEPQIVAARERVRSSPKAIRAAFGSTEDEQVATQLSRDLFLSPVKAKYGELWRRNAV